MASCLIEEITDADDLPNISGSPGSSAAPAAGSNNAAAEGPGSSAPLPMVPPEDCEKVTPDGGVLKKTITEGSGDRPCLHARCIVHYTGYLTPSGNVFLDTLQDSDSREPQVLVAGRDSSLRESGLQLALSTMKRGERAVVYITDPEYGYGKQGSFSFPSVPSNATLAYDVQLIEWEPPEEKLERSGMLFEERLEAAERRRLEGNTLFAEGKLVEALGKYAMALSYTDEDFMMQLEGPHLDKAEAVVVPVHLNMAAAQLKLGDYNTAIHNCAQVLMRDRDNAKALFRRGRARAALGQTEEAVADLEAASKLAPSDKAVLRELHAMRQQLKGERAASAKLFKGAFGAPPKPVPGGSAAAAYRQPPAAAAGGGAGGVLGHLAALLWGLLAWLLGGLLRVVQPRHHKAGQVSQRAVSS